MNLRCFVPVLLSLVGLALGGCATATQPAAMAVPAINIDNHSAGSVLVSVSGGSETSAMGASQISNADFAAAIRQSITASRLFATLADALPADYRLDVMIVHIQQPMFGASFTVTMECSWRLTHVPDSKVVWEKAITSSFTGKWNDAFAGVTRLRLATEGAARNNITDALLQMGRLSLPYVRRHAERAILQSFAPESVPSDRAVELLPKVFVRQLQLIGLDFEAQMEAISDYFRASIDRTHWGEAAAAAWSFIR